ncbi:hypothetical protein LINPERPRIM_LOCUS24649, partial [Linum perenne]
YQENTTCLKYKYSEACNLDRLNLCYPNFEWPTDNQHTSLVLQYKGMLNWIWEVQLQHIYRQDNFLAKKLSLKGHSLPLCLHLIPLEDSTMTNWLAYDRTLLTSDKK